MADQVPIRADLDGSSLTGLAIFSSNETVGVAHGGTGLATVGTNQLFTGNGTSALTSESNLTFTGTTLTVNIGASNDDNLILNSDQGWNPKLTYTEAGSVKAGIEYDGGACKMRLQTGGTTNAIVIDCNQNVGIGTSAPSGWLANSNARVLAIHNTDTTDGNSATELALSVAHSTSWNAISFTNGAKASSSAEGKILYDHNSNSMRLSTNASERMRIDSSGRVGIGTDSMSQKLDIRDDSGGLEVVTICNAANCGRGLYLNVGCGNTSHGIITAQNNPGTAMLKFTGDGKLGIGTAAPAAELHVMQTTSGTYAARFENNQLDGPTVQILHTGTTSTTNPVLAVAGAGVDALQVKSNGAFFLSRQGTGSGASDTGWYMNGAGGTLYGAAGSAVQYLSMSATGTILGFRYNDTYVGQVVISSGATSYQSASDYRLKENIVDLINATDRVAQLKPRRFNWKVDPDVVTDGFIAHEVENLVPEAVDGTKDDRRIVENVIAAADGTKIEKNVSEEDWEEGKTDTLYTAEDTIPDGKEIGDVKTAAKYPSDSTWEAEREVDWYQSMDNAKLVPVLTAAIQELTVRLEAAEAKITTLEAA